MTRVYCAERLATGLRVTLAPGASRHVAKVLRKAAGDELIVFDGSGGEYRAVIESIARAGATVVIGDWRDVEREAPIRVTLAQAISATDRMDFTLQKAVELGVAAIQPLAAARSVTRLDAERARKRVEHWRGVVVSACEQCGRNRVPPVAEVADSIHWLGSARAHEQAQLRLLLAPGATLRLRDLAAPHGEVLLLAGPEGGFTDDEEHAARAAGFSAVRLGPRTLRTETAALAALAAMHALWGDF